MNSINPCICVSNGFVAVEASNETLDDIKLRNKVMLDNSIQNAIFVAYNYMGKDIKITKSNNIVIGVTSENELKIGDKLIKCDGNEINDILDMSRIESGKINLEQTEVVLSEVLHDLKAIILGQINAKQLDLYMDAMDIMHECVYCDKTRLNQILLNLM